MIPLENCCNLSSIFVLAKRLFSQITVLFKESDNIPLSWGTEPSAYHLPASHSIRTPFNYRAGHKPVFPHHAPSALRPSFNDEKSAPGGLDICFIIILLLFIFWVFVFLSWRCMFVCQGVSLYTASFFFSFFFFILCSQAWNLMSWAWVCCFFIPLLRLQLHTYPLWLYLEPQLTTV